MLFEEWAHQTRPVFEQKWCLSDVFLGVVQVKSEVDGDNDEERGIFGSGVICGTHYVVAKRFYGVGRQAGRQMTNPVDEDRGTVFALNHSQYSLCGWWHLGRKMEPGTNSAGGRLIVGQKEFMLMFSIRFLDPNTTMRWYAFAVDLSAFWDEQDVR